MFPIYNILYKYTNTKNLGRKHQYAKDEPPWGGILTMIQKYIYTPENITKIPTPANISPYMQELNISNKPLTSFLIMNLYMPSYLQDLNLIPDIILQISILIKRHPAHKTILTGDFNRDIFLQGHIHKDIPQTPTHKDR